jgi:transcriptional regulator with XRE-family HTH domain
MQEPSELRLRVGKNVKRLRLLRGMGQDELAERVEKTGRHLLSLEAGGFDVGIDLLGDIAAVLDVDVIDFFRTVEGETTREHDDGPYWMTQVELESMEAGLRVAERVKRRRAPNDSD